MRGYKKVAFLLLFGFLSACSNRSKMEQEQIKLHTDFINYFQNVFDATEAKGKGYVETIAKSYNPKGPCNSQYLESKTSSLYFPKSVVRGNKLNCFMKATAKLDHEWEEFYNKAGYISWQYVYDDETKGLRIHPATNPLSLFGDNLTFESFYFFKGAVASYPKGAWSGIRDDINGTGKIIIYSQAMKLPKNKHYTVVGLDVKTNQIIRTFQELILAFASRHKLSHVFLYSYLKNNDINSAVHDFSTNPQKWSLLRVVQSNLINVNENELKALVHLEEKVVNSPLQIASDRLTLNGSSHWCTIARLRTVETYSLFCGEK